MASKTYESYEMLSKLLNSAEQEDIDKAYDALSKLTAEAYARKKAENRDIYEAKKQNLAANKAKADKYLNYFIAEKGYENSGIEADAKLKSQLTYDTNLNKLNAEEAENETQISSDMASAQLKNEAERFEKKAEAAAKQAQTELQNYWKQKELDYKNIKSSASSDASKEEIKNLNAQLNSYRQTVYSDIKSKFDEADGVEKMKEIYESVTGVNAEKSSELIGDKLYAELVKDMKKRITDKVLADENEKKVLELYNEFEKDNTVYPKTTYRRLQNMIRFSPFSGYTRDQLEEAYKRYKNRNK